MLSRTFPGSDEWDYYKTDTCFLAFDSYFQLISVAIALLQNSCCS